MLAVAQASESLEWSPSDQSILKSGCRVASARRWRFVRFLFEQGGPTLDDEVLLADNNLVANFDDAEFTNNCFNRSTLPSCIHRPA